MPAANLSSKNEMPVLLVELDGFSVRLRAQLLVGPPERVCCQQGHQNEVGGQVGSRVGQGAPSGGSSPSVVLRKLAVCRHEMIISDEPSSGRDRETNLLRMLRERHSGGQRRPASTGAGRATAGSVLFPLALPALTLSWSLSTLWLADSVTALRGGARRGGLSIARSARGWLCSGSMDLGCPRSRRGRGGDRSRCRQGRKRCSGWARTERVEVAVLLSQPALPSRLSPS